ncbi:hypothetical protein DV738_g5182, partial [Chaetothyriales sp. CBS 135597]
MDQPAFHVSVPSKPSQKAPSNGGPVPRPLSVSEAFRFTPLTTSPLHASDTIPIPTFRTRNLAAPLVSQADRKSLARVEPNANAKRQVFEWLDPSQLAEIKFKRRAEDRPQSSSAPLPLPNLSPLAAAVLENVDIRYRLGQQSQQQSQPQSARSANAAHDRAQLMNGLTPQHRKPAHATVATPQQLHKPAHPQPAAKSPRHDFAAVPGSPKRQKLSAEVDTTNAETALRLRTQKEQGDAAIAQLHDLLTDIFDAEDRIDPSSGNIPSHIHCFDVPDADEDFALRLTSSMHEKLQSLLKQLVALKRLQHVDMATLLRLQQLCAPAVTKSLYLAASLDTPPPDDDIGIWLDRLGRLENGESAAVTFLYTYLGNQSDKLRQQPEALSAVPGLLKHCFERLLIPVVEARPDGHASKLFALALNHSGRIKKLLDTSKKLLDILTSACVQLHEARECVSETEFLASTLIFVQNAPTDKAAALGPQTYERVRKQAMTSLASIFAALPLERSTILDNLLSSLDRLPSTSRSARQFKLPSEGKSIMFISALVIHNANDIVVYLLSKASKVSKSGDSPYRNILDLFVEDMISLLALPDWPAAELLLRLLANKLIDLTRTEKAAGVKNMALELLGAMGSAISLARASARNLASTLSRETDNGDRDLALRLVGLTDDHFAAGLAHQDFVSSRGPLALVSQYYQAQGTRNLRAKSARSFYLSQYAFLLSRVWDSTTDHQFDTSLGSTALDILQQLSQLASDSDLSTTNHSGGIGMREANLAYLLGILNLGFCKAYPAIIRTLLSSLSSDQAQVRSRSLKSVVTILETDPSLLDRDPSITDDVFKCASDDSAMVRDASLSLIAKFIISRPALEEKGVRRLLECAADVKVGVQKRAIGHLSDIYTQDTRPKLKAAIAQTFLRRTADVEDSVSELAKKALTEAWVTPHLAIVGQPADSAKSKVAMENLCQHVVYTLDHDPTELARLLTNYARHMLKTDKTADSFAALVDRLVQVLFESIITNTATSTSLLTLLSFAEARPESVAPQHLAHLRCYLDSVSAAEIGMFKSVIAIFRHVLPRLSATHKTLLKSIQDDLMKTIPKLARRMDLDEVMSCLRTIDGVLQNDARFAVLLRSVVKQICLPSVEDVRKVKLIRIAGSMGKHLDLDALRFDPPLPGYKTGSVAAYLTTLLYKAGIESRNSALELVSLESIGSICQAYPSQFDHKHIRSLFCSALELNDPSNLLLDKTKGQVTVLKAFSELFAALAATSEDDVESKPEAADARDLKKMGGNAKAQDAMSALSALANTIKKSLVAVALNGQTETATLAVCTLASLAERGMLHPKDYAGVFIALETSDDDELRRVATRSHQLAHQHHESHFEREYMHAVQEAFIYQKKLQPEPLGIWPGRAKLATCFEVVNTSGPKYVKKFLSNLVTRLSTDYTKLDVAAGIPDHLYFVRFIAQNIGFFEYSRLDDLLHVIIQLELLFSKNGAGVAEMIEIHNIKLAPDSGEMTEEGGAMTPGAEQGTVSFQDGMLLRRLAAAACAVTIISETRSHLRRQYGVSRDARAFIQQQKQTKELTAKPPTKVHGITGERFVAATSVILQSMHSEQAMLERCRAFHELMSVDDDDHNHDDDEAGDVQQGQHDGGMRDSRSWGPDLDGSGAGPRGRKRKVTANFVEGTPKKARRRPRKSAVIGTRRSASTSSREEGVGDADCTISMAPLQASQGPNEDGGAGVMPPPIDPISQQILDRTKSSGSSLNLATAASADDRDGSRMRPTSDPAAPLVRSETASTSNKLTKDRDKKRPDEAATESIESRLAGNEAEVFSGPVGFIPRLPGPPKYIKVKVQHRRKKSFDRLFLAQVLLGDLPQRSPRRDSIDSKIRSIDDQPPTQTRPPSRKADKAIWALEFSDDGRYLAAGGQDKKVRVWEVIQTPEDREGTSDEGAHLKLHAPVFKQPLLREYGGHTASILDLSWSKNNFLLSSSMDKTVRLYHVSRPECLCAFRHSDFVTSIQFHPRDDRFFLAGSLDSKIRLWSIPDRTVAYSQQVPDMVTAVAFTPDGKTAIAGTLTGLCILYDTEGLKPHSQIQVKSARGKSSKGSKITGIDTIAVQNEQGGTDVKLLITSNDSRIRMYNMKDRTLEVKFRGNENSCSQIHATFSDDAKYVICGSEDRKVYIWPTGPIEHVDGDRHPLEVFEAHSSIATTALLLPTAARRLLAQSGDPIYDLCNPPPVTLLSRADSVLSSPSPTFNSTQSTDDKRASGPDSRQSESPRRAPESPAYLARHDHYCGSIIVTADYSGTVKVFRQDCAHLKRRQDSWDDSSIFSKKMISRSASMMTKRSTTSSKQRPSSPKLGPVADNKNGSSERIISWRNSIHPSGGSTVTTESELTPILSTSAVKTATSNANNGPGSTRWTKRLSMRVEGTLKRNNGSSSPANSNGEGGGGTNNNTDAVEASPSRDDSNKDKRPSVALANPAIGPSIELSFEPSPPARAATLPLRLFHAPHRSNTRKSSAENGLAANPNLNNSNAHQPPQKRYQKTQPVARILSHLTPDAAAEGPNGGNNVLTMENNNMMPWDGVTRSILPMVQKAPRSPGFLGVDDRNPLSRQHSLISTLSSEILSSEGDPGSVDSATAAAGAGGNQRNGNNNRSRSRSRIRK